MLHQYLVTDQIAAFSDLPEELPFIRDPDESWYLRQERDGVILGPYEKDGQPWSIDGVPTEFGMELLPPDFDRIESIAAQCMERVPPAAEGGIRNIVNGPITFTPDANPLIGPAYALENAWVLTGSSMGVMEGGGAGQFLARWMTDGEPPADALAVDSRRFGGYADRGYRVDKAVECFAAQFGIHYPYEERPAGRMARVTPIYQALSDNGAVFGAAYGWERPNWFAPPDSSQVSTLSFQRANWFDAVAEECRCVAERVGIADLSVFSKFRVSGKDAEVFMNGIAANTAPSNTGQIRLMHMLTPSGGVASELSVTRVDAESYWLTSAAATERHDEDLLRQRANGFSQLTIENVTEQYGVLGVMGPLADALLSRLSDADFSRDGFPWLSAKEILVADVPTLALRVSYVGESGWELHHKMSDQVRLFEALTKAGRKLDSGFYGAFAMNAMRLEKGYRAWGADYTTERTLLESGGQRFVRAHGREFVGREKMLQREQEQGRWFMQLLSLEETGTDPFYSHPVMQDGKAIGVVTSGAYGHRVSQPLALAWFREEITDAPLEIEILGKGIAAKVLEQVPYDPENLRMK